MVLLLRKPCGKPSALSGTPSCAGPATAATRPNAVQGHALGRSFLQIPGNSPSPDPATLVKQNWADLSNTYNLLRSGGNPVHSKLQVSIRTPLEILQADLCYLCTGRTSMVMQYVSVWVYSTELTSIQVQAIS